jgi:hypothetical protein
MIMKHCLARQMQLSWKDITDADPDFDPSSFKTKQKCSVELAKRFKTASEQSEIDTIMKGYIPEKSKI